jgi:hypothetical protein
MRSQIIWKGHIMTTETNLISGPWSWTKKDITLLRRNYRHGNIKKLAERLNRPLTAVRQKAYDMGMKTNVYQYWTQEDLDLLRELYVDLEADELAKRFHRSANSIKSKARQLGLKKSDVFLKLVKSRPRRSRSKKT